MVAPLQGKTKTSAKPKIAPGQGSPIKAKSPQGIPPKGVIAQPARLGQRAHGHPVQGHPTSPVSPTTVQKDQKAKERREASRRVFRIFVEEFLMAYVKAYPAATPEEGRLAAADHWKSMPLGERAVYEALAACQVAHTVPEHVRLSLRRSDQSVVRKGRKAHGHVVQRGHVMDNGTVVGDDGQVIGTANGR